MANKNVLLKNQLHIKQWIFFSALIFLSHCAGQKRNDARDPVNPIGADKTATIKNDVLLNPKFRAGIAGLPQSAKPMKTELLSSRISGGEKDVPQQMKCSDEGNVIFPDSKVTSNINPSLKTEQEKLVPSLSDIKKCEVLPFACNESSFYPKNYIRQLISEKKLTPLLSIADEPINPDIQNRFDTSGDMGGDKHQFCDFHLTMFRPKILKNRHNVTRFIIQDPEFNVTQAIRVETCAKVGDNNCGTLASHLGSVTPLKMECVQKYGYRQMAAINQDGTVVFEPFQIPTCCVCMYF